MARSQVAKQAVNQIIQDTGVKEARRDNDTVRLWENFREQALLWRAIALMQIPATLIALFFALVIWFNRTTILNVPAKPLPGYYAADEIPDAEFISVATEFINLIATYQPMTARRQFREAARILTEPMLSQFDQEMLGREVTAIESTRRTQVYFVDPTKTEIIRGEGDDLVTVTMVGERQKLVAGEVLPNVTTQFRVTMTTIPKNTLNQYGIVVKNVEVTSAGN